MLRQLGGDLVQGYAFSQSKMHIYIIVHQIYAKTSVAISNG